MFNGKNSGRKAKLPKYIFWLVVIAVGLHIWEYTGWIDQPTASTWTGRVIAVADGDTLRVKRNGREIKIRLFGVDAPEQQQPFGRQSHYHLSSLAAAEVWVEETGVDQYGRTLAIVYSDKGESLNGAQVKKGLAWVYRQHCNQPVCGQWTEYEKQARQNRAGLWKDDNPTPPWQWRYEHKQ